MSVVRARRGETPGTYGGKNIVGLVAAAIALGGCGSGGSAPSPTGSATGMAVINGDFMVAAVSLLGPDGTLAREVCVDSSTGGGTLSYPLSGDLTLPSQPQLGGDLWLIDRSNDAVTVVDPSTCEVKGQVSAGTKTNPHDVLVISEKKVYITRYNKSLTSTDPTLVGDDIAILDRDTGKITGHIDLSTSAVALAGAEIQARPDRLVLANGKVYVTLWNADAMYAAYTHGRLVVIDPTNDTVLGTIDLPDLKGCEAIQHVAANNTLYVGCGGSYTDVSQMDGSGVAAIDLGTSPPTVKVTKASAFGQPVSFLWVAALSPTRVFTSTMGSFPVMATNTPGTNDKSFFFDPTTGMATALGLEAAALDLGRAAVGDGKLYVPDATANKPLIHVFDASGTGAPTETSSFKTISDPDKMLPPREIAWY